MINQVAYHVLLAVFRMKLVKVFANHFQTVHQAKVVKHPREQLQVICNVKIVDLQLVLSIMQMTPVHVENTFLVLLEKVYTGQLQHLAVVVKNAKFCFTRVHSLLHLVTMAVR